MSNKTRACPDNTITSRFFIYRKKIKRWLPEEEAKGLVVKQAVYYLDTLSFSGQTCQTPKLFDNYHTR